MTTFTTANVGHRLERPYRGTALRSVVAVYTTTFVEYDALHFFLIYLAEALAFLGVAGYSLSRWGRGASAMFGAAGGVVGLTTAGILTVGWAQLRFAESFALFEFLAEHEWMGQVMDWSRPSGVVLIGIALWQAGRARDPQT
jgi:hypothetical protein